MIGRVFSATLAAAILASVVANGGSAAAAQLSYAASVDLRATTIAQTAAGLERPAGNDGKPKGKGQGAKISALAKSIPGGPGKGAQISAAAKGHGKAVSAEAKTKDAKPDDAETTDPKPAKSPKPMKTPKPTAPETKTPDTN